MSNITDEDVTILMSQANIDKKTRICISLMYTILLKLYHEGSVWPIYLPVFLYLYIAHFLKIMDI